MHIEGVKPQLPHEFIEWLIPGDIHADTRASRVKAFYALARSLVERNRLGGIIFQGDTVDRPDSVIPADFLNFLTWLTERNVRVVMLPGNHDPNIQEIVHIAETSHGTMIPITYPGAEFRFMVSGRSFVVLHGDVFDNYIQKRKRITLAATWLYEKIQKIDGEEQASSRRVKRWLKRFLKLGRIVAERALVHAQIHGADVVICGHVHLADHRKKKTEQGTIHYYNTACFTAIDSYVVSITSDGKTRLHRVRSGRHR